MRLINAEDMVKRASLLTLVRFQHDPLDQYVDVAHLRDNALSSGLDNDDPPTRKVARIDARMLNRGGFDSQCVRRPGRVRVARGQPDSPSTFSQDREQVMQREFITTGRAAKVMACSERTIAKLYDAGTIAGYKLNTDRRILVKSFRKYLMSLTRDPTTKRVLNERLNRELKQRCEP